MTNITGWRLDEHTQDISRFAVDARTNRAHLLYGFVPDDVYMSIVGGYSDDVRITGDLTKDLSELESIHMDTSIIENSDDTLIIQLSSQTNSNNCCDITDIDIILLRYGYLIREIRTVKVPSREMGRSTAMLIITTYPRKPLITYTQCSIVLLFVLLLLSVLITLLYFTFIK